MLFEANFEGLRSGPRPEVSQVSMLMHFCTAHPAAAAGVTPGAWHNLLSDTSRIAAWVDFSLHLSPIDLDILVEQVCAARDAPTTTLTDSLVGLLAGDGESWGVETVSPSLVSLLAGVPAPTIEPLAVRWVEAVAREHREANPGVSEEVVRALSDLVRVCDVAGRNGLAVLYVWFL
jgi:hypothetical protein